MTSYDQILNNRNHIRIDMTRDSVCAGDDCDAPHVKCIEIPYIADPRNLLTHLSAGYLPSVAGVGHTWDCILNGQIIGTVCVAETKSVISEVVYQNINVVHFKYNSARY